MTPDTRDRFPDFLLALRPRDLAGLRRTQRGSASARRRRASGAGDPAPRPDAAGEACLGVADKGIFGDLDDKVQLALPADARAGARHRAGRSQARACSCSRSTAIPRKAYPLGGTATLDGRHARARAAPRRSRRARAAARRGARSPTATAAHDRDDDGIPDPLDVLIGAKKTVLNADAYTERPGLHHAEVSERRRAARRWACAPTSSSAPCATPASISRRSCTRTSCARRSAYPMIKGRPAIRTSISAASARSCPTSSGTGSSTPAKLDDPNDPLRPGDVIFMDTFPSRVGPRSHRHRLRQRRTSSGLPLVINNWTERHGDRGDGSADVRAGAVPVPPARRERCTFGGVRRPLLVALLVLAARSRRARDDEDATQAELPRGHRSRRPRAVVAHRLSAARLPVGARAAGPAARPHRSEDDQARTSVDARRRLPYALGTYDATDERHRDRRRRPGDARVHRRAAGDRRGARSRPARARSPTDDAGRGAAVRRDDRQPASSRSIKQRARQASRSRATAPPAIRRCSTRSIARCSLLKKAKTEPEGRPLRKMIVVDRRRPRPAPATASA